MSRGDHDGQGNGSASGDSFLCEVLEIIPLPPTPQPGERLGGTDGRRFEILGKLGRGGMGLVVRARDEPLQRVVALKFIAPGQEFTQEMLDRVLQDEARLVAQLDHENIVRIFDVSGWKGSPFLIMECLEGQSLSELLRRGPLELPRGLRILDDITAGLAHAHSRHIIHRDLKPRNVFVLPDGWVKLLDFGWPTERIDTLDEDMGQSGASASWRARFQRLAEDVARGRVGAIFSLEVSRLARSSADWHRLLELCALADVLIADEDSVYSPRDYNDRLLLGLKGTMSEAEQYWMRLRLQGGRLSKAKRGELFLPPPVGYEWDESTQRLRLEPDEQVQRMVRLVFERFRTEGSAFAVMRYFERNGLKMPVRDQRKHQVRWGPARHGTFLQMLHNPTYAGAYVFGRREERLALVDGQLKRRRITRMPQEEWKVCLRDHHPAYISWEEYLANQKKLHENRSNSRSPDQRGAAREGHALLQGLVLCGRCGHRMQTRYHGLRRHAYYECRGPTPEGGDRSICWMVAAAAIDDAIARLFLEVSQPPEIELGLAVAREVERQVGEVHHQWKLRLERVRYEAQLAERRYKAIDPDNRVVARTLEREWNDRLRELEETEHEYQEVLQHEKLELTDKDRARILALAKDLPRVWHAKSTTNAERKNLLRILMREVTLSPIEVPERMTHIQVVWQTGAVSDLSVPRRTRFEARKTSAEAIECIRKLFEEKRSDDEIAAELNRRGLRSGVKRPWDAKAVSWVRWRHGLNRLPVSPQAGQQPTRRADGLYSVRGVAEYFNVTKWIVYYWIKEGWLEGVEGGGMGRCWWFKLDSQTIKRLADAKVRGYGPGGRSHSKTHFQEEGHYA